LFFDAARSAASENGVPDLVRVYEKIRAGIWVYLGEFDLADAWTDSDGTRRVFKFKLVLRETQRAEARDRHLGDHDRLIPSEVRIAVWKRDGGRCVKCGQADHLHFDHIIPFSRGGSSVTADNIQLLCARHNLAKSDRIE
jgi:hypothetical protein